MRNYKRTTMRSSTRWACGSNAAPTHRELPHSTNSASTCLRCALVRGNANSDWQLHSTSTPSRSPIATRTAHAIIAPHSTWPTLRRRPPGDSRPTDRTVCSQYLRSLRAQWHPRLLPQRTQRNWISASEHLYRILLDDISISFVRIQYLNKFLLFTFYKTNLVTIVVAGRSL